jgi:branched-subunit amino acid permease
MKHRNSPLVELPDSLQVERQAAQSQAQSQDLVAAAAAAVVAAVVALHQHHQALQRQQPVQPELAVHLPIHRMQLGWRPLVAVDLLILRTLQDLSQLTSMLHRLSMKKDLPEQ